MFTPRQHHPKKASAPLGACLVQVLQLHEMEENFTFHFCPRAFAARLGSRAGQLASAGTRGPV